MTVKLSSDTRLLLEQYADGRVSNRELSEWLAQLEYDTDATIEERNSLASLRLVVTEVAEDLRNTDEILDEVSAILASARPAEAVVTVIRGSSSTTWDAPPVTGTASQVIQRGGISA